MVKAVLAGASGGIGQPLALYFKSSKLIDELALYDKFNTPGVGADIAHISTRVKTTAHLEDTARQAFTGADIVVITAGFPRKPGMTRDDLFNANAEVVKAIIDFIADYSPKAHILVVSNPVNSTVPIAAEALKAKGVFDAKRLFGVTTLDVVRAKTFIAELVGADPEDVDVPVIGGHSAHTIVPVLSQAKVQGKTIEVPLKWIALEHGQPHYPNKDPNNQVKGYDNVIERIQFAGDEVVGAKNGAGSATLSMAYAAFLFAEKVLQAGKGTKGLKECTMVYLPGVPGGDVIAKETGCDFFSVPVELGVNGAEKAVNILGDLSASEKELLKKCIDGTNKVVLKEKSLVEEFGVGLKANITKGVNYKPAPKEK